MRGLHAALAAGAMAAVLVLGGAGGAQAAIARSPKVTFSLSITYPADLAQVTGVGRFHGSTSGLATGTAVQVQRRVADGSWRTFATVKTAARGAYSGGFTPSGVGRETFRARVPASGKRAAVASGMRTLTVAKFFDLSELPLAHPADGVSFAPFQATPDGQVFPHTIVMDGAAVKTGDVAASWTVGGHCSKMFAEVATDGKETGLVAAAVVSDGKHLFSAATVDEDGFTIIQTPVSGARTLTLTTSIRKVGTGGQKVVWLVPSVLCTVDPRSL